MNKSYRPREGTLIFKVMQQLKLTGGCVNALQIVSQFGGDITATAAQLKPAVTAGLLNRERISRGFEWFLTPAGEELDLNAIPQGEAISEERLQAKVWPDGDVVVTGFRECEDGSIIFSKAQITRLVTIVTTPLVDVRNLDWM